MTKEGLIGIEKSGLKERLKFHGNRKFPENIKLLVFY
jgi:hypothetical protein